MRIPALRGVIDRRILVNYRVAPDVLARQLPAPFRPKLHRGHGDRSMRRGRPRPRCGACYDHADAPMKARVRNGRLVLDEATELPEGAEVDLVPADWWDTLDEEEQRRIEASLANSEHDVQAARTLAADVVLQRLRRHT